MRPDYKTRQDKSFETTEGLSGVLKRARNTYYFPKRAASHADNSGFESQIELISLKVGSDKEALSKTNDPTKASAEFI